MAETCGVCNMHMETAGSAAIPFLQRFMVDQRIKPYAEKQAGAARRDQQARSFRRNQIFGLLILATAIILFWLIRAPHGWAFPAGWWRL